MTCTIYILTPWEDAVIIRNKQLKFVIIVIMIIVEKDINADGIKSL